MLQFRKAVRPVAVPARSRGNRTVRSGQICEESSRCSGSRSTDTAVAAHLLPCFRAPLFICLPTPQLFFAPTPVSHSAPLLYSPKCVYSPSLLLSYFPTPLISFSPSSLRSYSPTRNVSHSPIHYTPLSSGKQYGVSSKVSKRQGD